MLRIYKLAFVMITLLGVSVAGAQDKVDIVVDLAGYTLTVTKDQKSLTYPITVGGAKYISAGTAPRHCLNIDTPPKGQFTGVRTYEKYLSVRSDRTLDNVIFYNRGFTIRAATRDYHTVGSPAFTCGAIALRPDDAQALFEIVQSADPAFVSVVVQ